MRAADRDRPRRLELPGAALSPCGRTRPPGAPRPTTSTRSTRRTPSCTRSAVSGTACSIPEGKASPARGQLLRREALELALYSFQYLDGIDSTLVLLPPRADGQAATAVFVERGDVRAQLDRPLDADADRTADARSRRDPGRRAARGRPHDALAALRVQLPAGAGRQPGHGAHAGLEWLTDFAGALARAKARLDTLDYYPEPVRIDRVRIRVAPWFFRIPGFRRYHGYALWRTILLRSTDAVRRSRHARALPHLAGPAPRSAHELEARDDALSLEPVRDRGAAGLSKRRDALARPPGPPTRMGECKTRTLPDFRDGPSPSRTSNRI